MILFYRYIFLLENSMIAVPFETGLTYTYNFTLTIDGQEYTISGKPNEKMSSINNLNMYGIAGIE